MRLKQDFNIIFKSIICKNKVTKNMIIKIRTVLFYLATVTMRYFGYLSLFVKMYGKSNLKQNTAHEFS